MSLVSRSNSAVRTAAGVANGFDSRNSATTPALCGAAIDVPSIVLVAASLVFQADVMATPGANQSTQAPMFENHARLSALSVAPMVSALGALAGDCVQASIALLPAAMEYVIPAAIEAATAASRSGNELPPRLMLATAGNTAFAVTQSTPAITCVKEPKPAQSSTRTATRFTSLATPQVVPPTVPDTCVPWPLQSSAMGSLSMKSNPWLACPPKSLCVIRIPVSIT